MRHAGQGRVDARGSRLDAVRVRALAAGDAARDRKGTSVLQEIGSGGDVAERHALTGKHGLLELERPIVRLLKGSPGEPYSILRVFERRDEGVDTASKSVDLTIRDITLADGAVVATVWRASADPEPEQAQALDTVQLQSVNLSLPLLHYSSGPNLARTALLEIAAARAFLSSPEEGR